MAGLQFVLMSLLFLFVYWWFMEEQRLERYAYLFWYVVIGAGGVALWGLNDARLLLATMMLVMLTHWYVGFTWEVGVVREPR